MSLIPDRSKDNIVASNFGDPLWFVQAAAERFSLTNRRVISIRSGGADHGSPMPTFSATSRAAFESLTQVLAGELGSKRIVVNAVAPGPTKAGLYAPEREHARAAIPLLGRVESAGEVAGFTAFLASRAAVWIAGQAIAVTGGFQC